MLESVQSIALFIVADSFTCNTKNNKIIPVVTTKKMYDLLSIYMMIYMLFVHILECVKSMFFPCITHFRKLTSKIAFREFNFYIYLWQHSVPLGADIIT